MTRQPAPGTNSRASAVGDLFAALEGLLISYQALPDGDREHRWDAEAELITGAVALHLNTARARIAAGSRPMARPAPPRAVSADPAPVVPPQAGRPPLAEPDIEPTDGRRPA